MNAAIAVLEMALEVATTNEPINRAEGRIEQADLEAENAVDFRQAIDRLATGRGIRFQKNGWELQVSMFLGENFAEFVAFMDDHGADESECDSIITALEALGNKG